MHPFAGTGAVLFSLCSFVQQYIGTFEVNDRQAENPELIKKGLRAMAEYMDAARPAVLILCLEGIKVIDARTQKVAMAHALSRVSLATTSAR